MKPERSTNRFRKEIFCVFGMLSFFVLAGRAETTRVEWTAGGGYAGQYWTNPANWSDKNVPHAGADYIVAYGIGYPMRTPDKGSSGEEITFLGDSLILGECGGKKGRVLQKTMSPSVTLFNRIVMNNGAWAIGSLGFGAIYGPITVNATKTDPFILGAIGTDDNRGLIFYGDLDGAGHLSVSLYESADKTNACKEVQLLGNNTNFTGTFTVSGENSRLFLGSQKAMGNEPSALLPDAVTIKNGGILGFLNGGTFAPKNRGITVEEHGSLIAQTYDATVNMPITGNGSLEKAGSGHLLLCGSYSAGDLSVRESVLDVGGLTLSGTQKLTARYGGGLRVTTESIAKHKTVFESGGALLACYGCQDVTVTDGTFESNMIFEVSANYETATASRFHLRGDQTSFTPPVKLRLYGNNYYTNATFRIPVLTIPASIRTVTTNDFALIHFFEVYGDRVDLSVAVDSVTENGETMQTVSVVYSSKMVFLSKIMGPRVSWSSSGYWSDGLPATGDKDYLVNKAVTLRTPEDNSPEIYSFPGRSLTLGGLSDKGVCDLTLKCPQSRYDDLRLYSNARVQTGSVALFSLYGNFKVFAPRAYPAMIRSLDNNRSIDLYAGLSGSGAIQYCNLEASGSGVITLLGDNSGFNGPVSVIGGSNAKISLKVDDESRLGSAPAVPDASAFSLLTNATLHATRSLMFSAPTRGIHLAGGPVTFEADSGLTFTVTSPLMFSPNAELTLSGGGVFCFGGGPVTASDTNHIIFSGSSFYPQSWIPFGKAGTHLAANATLLLEASSVTNELGTFGLNIMDSDFSFEAGATVRVLSNAVQVGKSFSVPVFTVPAARAKTFPVELLNVEQDNDSGYDPPKWETTETTVNGAAAVTFSLHFPVSAGMTLLLK